MEEDESYGQTIIKLNDEEEKLTKSIGDKMFKFESTIDDDYQLRLSLKEVNCYSPYFYEIYFTYSDLISKYQPYEGMGSIKKIKSSIDSIFHKPTTRLELTENDTKIIIHGESTYLEIPYNLDFELDRKTVENKDGALKFLYNIEDNNYNLIEKIKEICKKEMEKNDKVAQEILRDLTKKFENYY